MGRGKYSEQSENYKGKMLISILIMAVLAVATGVLVLTAPGPEEDPGISESVNGPSAGLPGEGDNLGLEGPGINGNGPDNSNGYDNGYDNGDENGWDYGPAIAVERVTVLFRGSPLRDNEFTEPIAGVVPLSVRIEPANAEIQGEITWESSNTAIFEVVPSNPPYYTEANVTIQADSGRATLTVTVDGVYTEVTVRARGPR